MKKSKRNNSLVEKILQKNGIAYDLHFYNKNERDAVKVASMLGVQPARVFKTLVVLRDRGRPLLVMIPADQSLNLKKLAAVLGEKKVKMASQAEAEKLTGLKAGGISPLALINRRFDPIIDQSCQKYNTIFVSGGQKGTNLQIKPGDLIGLVEAAVVGLVEVGS